MISTAHRKENFIIRVIYVYPSMHESVLAVRDECQLLWPRHVHRLCPIGVRRAATPLINRVMVYRPGNCVCHRQRGIKAYSDVNIIGQERKLWHPPFVINSRDITPRRNYISVIVPGSPDL